MSQFFASGGQSIGALAGPLTQRSQGLSLVGLCKEKEWSGVIWQVESWHSEEALGELAKRIGIYGI